MPEQPVVVCDGSGVLQVDAAGQAAEVDHAQGLAPSEF